MNNPRVREAVAAATEAVAADNSGEYQKAYLRYMRAVDLIEGQLSSVSDTQRAQLTKYAESYRSRIRMLLPFVNTAVDGPSDVGRRSHGTAQSSPGTVAAAAPSGTTAAAAPSASTAHVATASSMGPVVSVSSNSITSTPAALAMRPAGGRHVAASAPVPVGASQHDSDAHGGSRAAAENIMRDVTMIVTMPAPTDLSVDAPPPLARLRPFWLMKLLGESILKGGPVTASLFVPKAVWHQRGARCIAFQAKLSCFRKLRDQLVVLHKCEVANTAELTNVVARLELTVQQIQHALSKELAYVPDPQGGEQGAGASVSGSGGGSTSAAAAAAAAVVPVAPPPAKQGLGDRLRAFGSAVMRNASQILASATPEFVYGERAGDHDFASDNAEYLSLATTICVQSQILAEWMAHYDKFRPTAIQRSLHNIAEFFQRVFCGVVITDAHSWLTQYLARTNEVLLL